MNVTIDYKRTQNARDTNVQIDYNRNLRMREILT